MADDDKKKKKSKKMSIGKSFDPSKYIDTEPMMEAKSNIIVTSFGRLNPITVGHEKLVNKIITVAAQRRADAALYLSHSQDAKKNPLSYEDKGKFAAKAFGKIVRRSKARNIIEVAKDLSGKYEELIVVVGSDRVPEFTKLLNAYNGKEYNFKKIEIVSAGDRDPDADDVSGMSASKLRNIAAEGNFEEFKRGLPQKLRASAKEVYNAVRNGMNINEEFEDILEDEEIDEARAPLTLQQRRKRAMTMRRFRSKIKVAKKRAARRKASPEKLKARAQRKARNIIRKRLAAQKSYGDMTPAEKIALDRRLSKISPAAIDRIARKQLPMVRKAEQERLKSVLSGGAKNESLDEQFEAFLEACERDTQPRKRFHMALEKNGSVKLDKRFKMFRKTCEVNESEEDFLDEAASLMEAVEKKFSDDPKNREQGTDSLVKIYKSMTPGQEMSEGLIGFIDTQMMTKKDISDAIRLKTDKQLQKDYNLYVTQGKRGGVLSHSKLKHIRDELSNEIKKRNLNEDDQLDEASLSQMVDAVRKYVMKGNALEDAVWELSRIAGADASAKQILNAYKAKYKDKPDNSSHTALKKKYGFAEAALNANIERGDEVSFTKKSVYEPDQKLKGTFVGTCPKTGRMRIRLPDGMLHVVKHMDVDIIESVDINEKFEKRLDE